MVTVDEVRRFAMTLPRTTEALVGGRVKFRSDLRYHWVLVRMAAIDEREMRELVLDAWRMVVPKSVAAAYSDSSLSDIR